MLVKFALDKLKYYQDLEEQGLLIKLPCRIGDIVYRIRHNLDAGKISIFELEVSEINISHVNNSDVTQIVCRNNFEGTRYHYTLEEIGKYVFFTKSEAEQALAKIKGNKSERG
jgi:poly-beta-hydroxyalkanoate depolymerase